MQYALSLLALASAAAAQGVTASIPAPGSPPAGCSPNYSGTFEVTVVTPPTKRGLHKRAPPLVVSLANGILTDSLGRTGYIASNHQFQFDNPPQNGAIYTSNWAACSNGSLSLGSEVLFWQCLTSNFFNIYDENVSAQCNPVEIEIIPGSGGSSGGSGGSGASSTPPASVGVSTSASAVVPPESTGVAPTTSIIVPPVSSMIPVSQISDGQIQATVPVAPITQISDGQVQATAPVAPITQISDGQIQATAPVAPAYTGAANPLALGSSFFAVAAGAAAMAMV